MSTHAAIVPAPLPLPVALAPGLLGKRDATTEAVLRYFEAERKAATGYAADKLRHADAFDHLTAICWKATRPYFLTDRHGSVIIEDTPQFNGLGNRTGLMAGHEGTAHHATREWIHQWLLQFVAPYRDLSPEELLAAADAGTFRYIGRLCRSRLIDALRRETAEKKTRPPHVSLNTPIGEDGGTLLDYLGTDRQDAPSSLSDHASFEDLLACAKNAFRVVIRNAEELRRLDLLDGLRACLSNAERALDRYYEGFVTRSIARLRGISERAARDYKRMFQERMKQQLYAGNRIVRAIFRELGPITPPYTPQIERAEMSEADSTESFFQAHGCAWDTVEE